MIYVYFIIKEAVCEYRLFFYLYYRLQRNFRVLRVIRGFFLGSLKARNLWRKSLIKIWPMARNQSSEFRRSHEKTRILVKDYSKDFYLDFEPVRRSIIKRSYRATYCCAFWYEIFVKDFISV